MLPYLTGEVTESPRKSFFYMSDDGDVLAIRMGDWKLIEFYEFSDAELYNLRADPGEHQNLASEEPIKFTELRAKLRAWQESVKATMPQPNPEWTP